MGVLEAREVRARREPLVEPPVALSAKRLVAVSVSVRTSVGLWFGSVPCLTSESHSNPRRDRHCFPIGTPRGDLYRSRNGFPAQGPVPSGVTSSDRVGGATPDGPP